MAQIYQMPRYARPTVRFFQQVDASLAVAKIAQIMFECHRDAEAGCVNDLPVTERSRYYRHAEAALRRLDVNTMQAGAIAAAQALVDLASEQDERGGRVSFPELRSLRAEEQIAYLNQAKRAITAYEQHLQEGVDR